MRLTTKRSLPRRRRVSRTTAAGVRPVAAYCEKSRKNRLFLSPALPRGLTYTFQTAQDSQAATETARRDYGVRNECNDCSPHGGRRRAGLDRRPCCLPLSLTAIAARAKTPEAELYDIFGITHYPSDFVQERTQAIVVVVLDDNCPVVQQSIPTLRELDRRYNGFEKDRAGRPTEFAKYPGDRVLFLGVYVKPDLGAKNMASHAAETRIPFRVLHDPTLALIKQLGLTRLSEVAVLDRQLEREIPRTGRRPICPRRRQARRRRNTTWPTRSTRCSPASRRRSPRRPAVGCKISFDPPPRRDANLTFYRDVAPIMQRHCAVVPSRRRSGADAAGNLRGRARLRRHGRGSRAARAHAAVSRRVVARVCQQRTPSRRGTAHAARLAAQRPRRWATAADAPPPIAVEPTRTTGKLANPTSCSACPSRCRCRRPAC